MWTALDGPITVAVDESTFAYHVVNWTVMSGIRRAPSRSCATARNGAQLVVVNLLVAKLPRRSVQMHAASNGHGERDLADP